MTALVGTIRVLALVGAIAVLIGLQARYRAAVTEAIDAPRTLWGWTAVWSVLGIGGLTFAWSVHGVLGWALVAVPLFGLAMHAATRGARWPGVLVASASTIAIVLIIRTVPVPTDPEALRRSSARAHAIVAAMRAEADACRARRAQCDALTLELGSR